MHRVTTSTEVVPEVQMGCGLVGWPLPLSHAQGNGQPCLTNVPLRLSKPELMRAADGLVFFSAYCIYWWAVEGLILLP